MPRTPKSSPAADAPVAYSYLRFSSPEQAKGDSLRRQAELRDGWLKRSGAVLDTTIRLTDAGVSAFTGRHRANPDRHALAAFLQLVKDGRIRRGSYLVVESLDRLSREHIRPALTLLLNLIDHGVRVVQLLPVETVYDEQVEPMALMMAIMELSRGHSESRMKSERMLAAWRGKLAKAAAGAPVSRALPAWLTVVDGRFVVREDRAAAVRRVYRLAVEGYGAGTITRKLAEEGVPPVAGRGGWRRAYVTKLLRTRTVLGEFQPLTRGTSRTARKPAADPIPNYFPPIVPEPLWHAARAGLSARRSRPGRIGKTVNLFAGLAKDARDGGSLTRVAKGRGGPYLASYRGPEEGLSDRAVPFPLAVFEAAVLSQLREIDPRELLPGEDRTADRVLELSGKVAGIEGKIAKLQATLLGEADDLAPVVAVLRQLEADRLEAAAALAAARQAAATPLGEAWTEYRGLVDMLATAADSEDARTRLRAALRRVVGGIWCVFIRRGQSRLAAVQVWFEGGAHRDYLIRYTRSEGNKFTRTPAAWDVRSFKAPGGGKGGLDLRTPGHAARLEKALMKVVLE